MRRLAPANLAKLPGAESLHLTTDITSGAPSDPSAADMATTGARAWAQTL